MTLKSSLYDRGALTMPEIVPKAKDYSSGADQEKQRDEFMEIAFTHLNSMYKTALYLTNNPSEAEDLVQETLLRAYKFFHLFKKGTNCRAWLLKILQNNFRNHLRRVKREPIKLKTTDPKDYDYFVQKIPSTSILGPDEECMGNEAAAEIGDAISALPEKLKMAVILADVKNLSYQEISETLDCPIGTVRSRIARGRLGLRRSLKGLAISMAYLPPEAN